jgi:hypothetical protein
MFLAGERTGGSMDQELTEHQRRCLEHLRQAGACEQRLTEYARAHGLSVKMLYAAAGRLRKKGLIAGDGKAVRGSWPGSDAVAENERSPFIAVGIAGARARSEGFLAVLRLNHVHGHVLEFGDWPPAEVMRTILAGGGHDPA